MFTGIIKKTGLVKKVFKKNNNCTIQVKSKINFTKDEIGSSVSCSGACLTVEKVNKDVITFYASKETLNKTIFKFLKKGDIINLEKSLKYGERISGHFVQGHIDTTSEVKEILVIGKSWLIDFRLKNKYIKYLMEKSSITINGVSLTIANILKDGFQISIIPKTLELTNLILLKKKDLVNVELDILGKYVKYFFKKK